MLSFEEILETFRSSRVLITGGTGMVGRSIASKLLSVDALVTSISLDDTQIPGVICIFGDLCSFDLCKTLTKNVDYVFHVAGIKGSALVIDRYPASTLVPLLMMNTNVLEACKQNNVKKVVYTSSIGAYSASENLKEFEEFEQTTPMELFAGWAKRIGELQVRAYRYQYELSSYAVVRLSNTYGPGDNFDIKNAMVVPSLIHKVWLQKFPIVMYGDGIEVRDLCYSDDIAEGIIAALYYGTESRYYNLGSGNGYSIKELVETLQTIVPFEYTFESTSVPAYPRRVMDISLAKEKLGYCPKISLQEGLKRTWEWFCINHYKYLYKKNYLEG